MVYKLSLYTLLFIAPLILLRTCEPSGTKRYYLKTESMPEGMITSVIDKQYNKQLLYILTVENDPPSINTLPISWLDVKSVSTGPFGQYEVTVWNREEEEQRTHTVSINSGLDFPTTLIHTDTTLDGSIDFRGILLPTETGHIRYFDLDCNGVLDVYMERSMEAPDHTVAYILVENSWIQVKDDESLVSKPFLASPISSPNVSYSFQDGIWRKLP